MRPCEKTKQINSFEQHFSSDRKDICYREIQGQIEQHSLNDEQNLLLLRNAM